MANCATCGMELDRRNVRRSFSPVFAANRVYFGDGQEPVMAVCMMCQGAEFDRLQSATDFTAALFYFCVRYDIPLYKDTMKKTTLNKWWQMTEPLWASSGGTKGFLDGEVTRLPSAQQEETEAVKEPSPGTRSWNGCKEARAEWNDDNITHGDWTRLEELKARQLASRPAIDETGMDAVREYCRAAHHMEKALLQGDPKAAKEWQTVMEKALSRENLLKRQASVAEVDRLAGLVEHIEKTVGGIPSLKELLDWMFVEVPELHGYRITADAADVALNDMENHYRENDGLPPLIERPPDKKLKDRLHEFADSPSEMERNTIALIREYIEKGSFDGMDMSALAVDE